MFKIVTTTVVLCSVLSNYWTYYIFSCLFHVFSSVYESRIGIRAPYIVPSPYGGQLIYCMPGDNFLFVHLKDKTKIRHKKRWSQVNVFLVNLQTYLFSESIDNCILTLYQL